MYTKFYKNLLIISLLIIGGILVFGINTKAQTTCVPACDAFTEDCLQDPETGSYDCLPKSAAGCPGGCPTGQECQWDSVDGSWACELITTGGSVPSGCEYCAGTADEAACIDDCLNGGGATSSTGSGPTQNQNTSQFLPAPPIGNATLPNWLCPDPSKCTISQLITNVADFIINYIALPLAVLMIILAGFRFATAQGNEEKLKKAKSNFIWTIIGVGIVLAAKILIVYIQELLTGTSGGTLTTMINRIKGTLNLVIALLFALVTVYFIWGVIQYVGAAGNEEKLKEGRRHMIWGIIGMSIMGAAWGIVLIIKNYITGS